jgi:hypothetical protein
MRPVRSEQDQLRSIILELLDRRGRGKAICPSDAARALAGSRFRPLMETVRVVAVELAADGEIEVTQRGEVVDIAQARDPSGWAGNPRQTTEADSWLAAGSSPRASSSRFAPRTPALTRSVANLVRLGSRRAHVGCATWFAQSARISVESVSQA